MIPNQTNNYPFIINNQMNNQEINNNIPMNNQNFNNINQINNQGNNFININPITLNNSNNPMLGSANSLYAQNFQQTWNNMQGNVNLIETNFNNMNNILSLINLPVVVPYHSHHPLINCKTPGRNKPGNYWKCNNCGADYSYNVPTFYCTNCDYDLCQKCFLSLYAFQIVIYNYNMGIIRTNENTNPNYYFPFIHEHPMVLISREASYYTSDLKCNLCFQDIIKENPFHYCSLCNYCICIPCYNSKFQGKSNLNMFK